MMKGLPRATLIDWSNGTTQTSTANSSAHWNHLIVMLYAQLKRREWIAAFTGGL